jgi:hypothetical protein
MGLYPVSIWANPMGLFFRASAVFFSFTVLSLRSYLFKSPFVSYMFRRFDYFCGLLNYLPFSFSSRLGSVCFPPRSYKLDYGEGVGG